MLCFRHTLPATALLSLMLTPALAAQTTESAAPAWGFSGKVRAGLEYQSNVNVSELNQASGRSDNARLLETDVNASWQATDKLQVFAGYSLQDKQYQNADDYNLRLQLAFLDSQYQLGATSLGINLYHADARLASAPFLTLTQSSVYAMHSASDTWYLRPALTLGQKRFDNINGRDAQTRSLSADSFWFSADGQRFISLGLRYDWEAADATEFRYQAPAVQLKMSTRFTAWTLPQQLQFGARVARRQYQSHSVANTAAARNDLQRQLDLQWQLGLSEHFALISKLEFGDFQSILDSADYTESRGSLSLQLSF